VFNKWIKRKEVPKNGGKSKVNELEKLEYVKAFELQLSNMEDSPVYDLKHQLSIGSEIGNIVIADPSVSPRHASFILQEDVVSVIDHGSVAGTFVNGKKIAPGKYIILEETDVINVGDLEVRLLVRTESVPAEKIPEVPEKEKEKEVMPVSEPLKESVVEKVQEIEVKPSKKAFDPRAHLKKHAKNTPSKKVIYSTYSANSLVRVFAVLSDFLLAYSLLVVFMPFDDFRNFMEYIPVVTGEILGVEWSSLWSILMEDYAFVSEMLNDAYQFFSETFQIVPILIMFVLLRASTTLLFGVSISEYALGIRPTGNGVWARLGGVIRVLIGVVTGPFLIFDVPAVVSRKTFKEFITFTCTTLSSKFLAVLGIILYLPLLVALALLSPLIQGFEPPEPIIVSDKIEQRVKVKVPEEGESPAEVTYKKDQSRSLNLELVYDAKEITLIPEYKFQGVKSKLNLKNGLVFYQKDLQRSVEFEVLKKFDLKQLIGIGLKGNLFLHDKYPILYNFVYSNANANPSFKQLMDEKAQLAFANEFIRFTKMAFSLSIDNFSDIMQEETLLIKGLVEFKKSFLSLLEYKDFSQISFIKIGNTLFLRATYNQQKPFDLIIPLIKGESHIFKVTWDKNENISTTSSKFYKFNLDQSDWLLDSKNVEGETMSALEVFDLFSSNDFKSKLLVGERAQRLYGYYYETTQEILRRGDSSEIDLWKSKLEALPKLLDSIPASQAETEEMDPKMKLLQNFRDLVDALENNNLDYFGISQTTTI
jgi:hypothetical protein